VVPDLEPAVVDAPPERTARRSLHRPSSEPRAVASSPPGVRASFRPRSCVRRVLSVPQSAPALANTQSTKSRVHPTMAVPSGVRRPGRKGQARVCRQRERSALREVGLALTRLGSAQPAPRPTSAAASHRELVDAALRPRREVFAAPSVGDALGAAEQASLDVCLGATACRSGPDHAAAPARRWSRTHDARSSRCLGWRRRIPRPEAL